MPQQSGVVAPRRDASSAAIPKGAIVERAPTPQDGQDSTSPVTESRNAVDGARLLDDLRETFCKYLVLPEGAPETLSLFVLHTYAFDAADITPILALTSPVKQCGKSRAEDVLQHLVRNPLRVSQASASSIIRTLKERQVTFVLDEADTFITKDDRLRGILNGGQTRSGAATTISVPRGNDWASETFYTFFPKVVAAIGKLPPTLHDRSICLPMRRKRQGESVARLRLARLAKELAPLREKCVRWATVAVPALRDADPPPIAGFGDRANDNWEPLLAIADYVGGPWPERARGAAQALAGAGDDASEDNETQLLTDLRLIFAEQDASFLSSQHLVDELKELPGRPWADYGVLQRGLTTNMLARLLKPFSVEPVSVRNGPFTERGYQRQAFADAWDRYLGKP